MASVAASYPVVEIAGIAVQQKVGEASVPIITMEELRALKGSKVGCSPWMLIDQERIDAFAAVTEDRQFIHTDPERAAAEGPFGGTIAQGFLTMSLLVRMAEVTVPRLAGTWAMVNFGFDKLRFMNPVPVGTRVRGCFTFAELTERTPEQLLLRYAVSIEIEGQDRLALAAHWLSLAQFISPDQPA